MEKDINEFRARAIAFIVKEQNSDGSFFSSEINDSSAKQYQTTFYSSFILASLSAIDDKKLQKTKNEIAQFLLKEKKENGSYNYWAKKFQNQIDENYPDDLDDTACAYTALLKLDKKMVEEKDLALMTKILISLEQNEGGPYYTWVMPKTQDDKWRDVDIAVNANVSFFLSLLGITLPGLESFADEKIKDETFASPYYYSKNSVLYFISRFYKGSQKNKLHKIISEENKKAFENPFECSLLGLSLLALGVDKQQITKNIKYLLSQQNEDGSLNAFPFVIERTGKERQRISGSKFLTTALALELISKFIEYPQKSTQKEKDEFALLQKEVVLNCQNIFKKFGPELQEQFDCILKKIVKDDTDFQTTLHPFLFAKSLKIKIKLDKKYLLDLASAGIIGWVAYTIYDNIIDEKKDIDKLPLAIICSRELERLYCQDNPNFRDTCRTFLDRVDLANFNEIKKAHFDPNEKLRKNTVIYDDPISTAEKSIAHCLGPLAVLHKLGFSSESKEFVALINFYQQYLSARQINDDAHDWEEDLIRGQVNFAGELLLKDFYTKNHRQAILSKDSHELKSIFWINTIIQVCNTIQDNVKNANESLATLEKILEQDFLSEKISNLDNAAKKSLAQREKTIAYLDNLFTA